MDDMLTLLNTPTLEIYMELFRQRDFDFITIREGLKHEKQEQALMYLTDKETKELGYGGAAGGAKSWTGCAWEAFMSLLYPDTRWFIAREELKRLRESTLITFFKVAKQYDIRLGRDWNYNGQDHFIQFANGSRIDLLEAKFLPSDPLFERFGSIEYTGGFFDELGEISFIGYDTLKSRCGRQLNDRYGITPKVYGGFNPKKNFVDTRFYRPFKENKLPPERKFIQALLYDNPHRESQYEAQLKSLSNPVQRARLLDGNFDYDDDPASLCSYDDIRDCFTNDFVKPTGIKHISSDLAMQGRDRFVTGSWDGMVCTITIDKEKATGKTIETDLKIEMIRSKTSHSNTIIDSDGLGAYLESYLSGIKEFHGGARAYNHKEFANLKSECGYKLAEIIRNKQMLIKCTPDQREAITIELGVLKSKSVDADEKRKAIISKAEMKELLGHSPDYLDMLLMGMYFYVKTKPAEVMEQPPGDTIDSELTRIKNQYYQ